jgi:hypothetical protein
MDFLFHTAIFSAVINFLQAFWNDGTGRIVLVTFLAYSTSYMIYSGYLSWFAGGYGGLLLTQMGFSVIDLLGLLPMAFTLLSESLWSLIKTTGKLILFHFIFPFVVLWTTTNLLLASNILVFPGNIILRNMGFLLWTVGSYTGVMLAWQSKEYKWLYWLSISICYFGMVLVGLTAPFAPVSAIKAITVPFQTTQDLVNSVLFEGTALIAFLIVLMIPLLIGRSMASHAAKQKLLSRVQKLVLTHTIEIPGALSTEKATKKKKSSSEVKDGVMSYYWEKDKPIYLVASLNRTTAFYIPSETTGTERRMVLLANDVICLMEI